MSSTRSLARVPDTIARLQCERRFLLALAADLEHVDVFDADGGAHGPPGLDAGIHGQRIAIKVGYDARLDRAANISAWARTQEAARTAPARNRGVYQREMTISVSGNRCVETSIPIVADGTRSAYAVCGKSRAGARNGRESQQLPG